MWKVLPPCLKSSYVLSVGLVINLKPPLRNGFIFSEKRTALKVRYETKEFTDISLSRWGVSCIVSVKDFVFFSRFWQSFENICRTAVSKAGNQMKIGQKKRYGTTSLNQGIGNEIVVVSRSSIAQCIYKSRFEKESINNSAAYAVAY